MHYDSNIKLKVKIYLLKINEIMISFMDFINHITNYPSKNLTYQKFL